MDSGQLLAPEPPEPPDPPDFFYRISIRSFPSPNCPNLWLQPLILIIKGFGVFFPATTGHHVVVYSTLFMGSFLKRNSTSICKLSLLCFRICVAFRFEISPPIKRQISTLSASTVNPPSTSLSSNPSVDSKDDEDSLANHQRDSSHQVGFMVALANVWPSSLNKFSSTSSVVTKTFFLCTSKYHSMSSRTLRVRYMLCSYSPSTLFLDVYMNLVDLGLDMCSYSSIILVLDVCETFPLGLLSDCSRSFSPFSYYAYKPTIRSLLPCPSSSSSRFILLRLRLEELHTDDPLSVPFKGSTLISAADCKIVKPVYVAASITEFSSVAVILTFDCVILLLRCYGVEIQGRLYIICCLCLMIALIFGVFVVPAVGSRECIFFDFSSCILCKHCSFIGV